MGRTLVNSASPPRCPSRRFALVLSCRRGDAAQARGLADHPGTGDPVPKVVDQAVHGKLASLLAAFDEILALEEPDGILKRAAELALERIGLKRVGIFLLDRQRNAMLGTWGTDITGQIVDEHHIMYDVSETDREAFRRSEEEGAHFTVFENCPIVEHHKGETRVVGRGWVACTPIRSTRAPIGMLFNDTGVSGEPVDEAKQTHAAILCSLLGTILDPVRGSLGHGAAVTEESPSRRLVTATVSMLAKDPAMGGKQIAAKLDISLSRLARVFKARDGHVAGRIPQPPAPGSLRGAARSRPDEPARSGARGRLRQLRAVPPRVPRAAPHDTARVPAQPELTRMRPALRSLHPARRMRRPSAASSTAAARRPRAASASHPAPAPPPDRPAPRSPRAAARPISRCRPAGGVPRPSGAPGNVTVLDWAGFKAAVSYTFDDTNSSQIQHYAELQALGVRMTFYLITGKTAELADPAWARAVKDGHELGNHSRRHVRAGTAADLEAADSDLRGKFGITVYTMASPYGDASYPPLATTRYLINRGVVNGLIAPGDDTDPFNIHCYVPPARAAAATFNAEIDAVRNGGGWTTVLVHGFLGGSDGAYQPVDIGEFTPSVNHAKSFGDVWIDSVVERRRLLARAEAVRRDHAHRFGEFEDVDLDPAPALPARPGPARQDRRRHADAAWRADAGLGRSRLL